MAESSPLEGYTSIPNLVIDALGGENGSTYSVVLFIARHTIGRQMKVGDAFYRVKEVCLSYDEFAKGRRKRDGSRMPDTSGLKYDDAIERGIQNAVAHGFIDIVSTTGQRGVRVYSIVDTFWLAAGFTTALKMLADPRIAASATAWKILAVGEQNPSSAPDNPSSSAREILADTSPEAAQEEAGRDFKQRYKHRDNIEDTKIQELEAFQKEDQKKASGESMTDGAAHDVDSFAQRYADQQILQSLLAERQSLQTLQPGQSGWGAAQRRLRALAPEIARLQAIGSPQTTEAITTEPEALSSAALTPKDSRLAPGDLLSSSMNGPSSPASEDATELAARRLRLLALQQELTQLKRTPSMQLMARQRIPRLEEAIKHLIASLAQMQLGKGLDYRPRPQHALEVTNSLAPFWFAQQW